MKISIELNQSWGTAKELLEYLRLLSRTMERICEMEVEAPADWYIEIIETRIEDPPIIKLTHLR